MPDFTTYTPPGVYVEEERAPLVSVIGVSPSVVGIVGPSVGYRTFTEAVVLTGTNAVQLAKLGIDQLSVVVRDASGTTYAGTEYALVEGPGDDASLGTTIDNTTTIARSGTSTIPDGSVVYVDYHYTDADYEAPQRVRDFDDVVEKFGQPLNLVTGAITSPLSLAAKVAFENGANELVLVSAGASAQAVTRTELSAGVDKLDVYQDVNLVVPLPVAITGTIATPGDTANVGSDLKAALDDAATNGILRVGILGYERTVTVPPETSAAAFRSNRVILAWPNRMSYYNGYSNQEIEVAGYYLAAAMAGTLARNPSSMPLTRKPVRGFSGIPGVVGSTLTTTYKNTLGDQGVSVVEVSRVSNGLVVRHGVTTDRTSVHTREISLVRAKDALINLCRDTMERADLIGTPIEDDTIARIKSVVTGVLEAAKTNKVIRNYTGVTARQQSLDPTIIEVKFQYDPLYPLNYIVVVFSINTTTGEIAPIETAA